MRNPGAADGEGTLKLAERGKQTGMDPVHMPYYELGMCFHFICKAAVGDIITDLRPREAEPQEGYSLVRGPTAGIGTLVVK